MASSSTDDLDRGAPADGGTVHPHYVQFAPVWTRLRHAFDGTGGFADGTYLAAHPREWVDYRIPETFEAGTDASGQALTTVKKWKTNPNPVVPTAKLKARRKIARYENLAGPIVEQKLAAIFRQGPTRLLLSSGKDEDRDRLKDHPFKQWEEDCDGYGTPLTEFMKEAERLAQEIGFSLLVMDRAPGPVPKSMAEQKLPVLRLYSPLDAPDWLLDANGQLSQIALLEAVPRTSLKDSATLDYRRRVLTETTWQTLTQTKTGTVTRGGKHGFGRLPVVTLYAKRPALLPWIGQSILGDPKLYIDLFNLTSELRELLRNQTFSILNVTLGTGDTAQSVQEAQNMMGVNVGTDNVLFTASGAGFISPDAANVKAYQEEREDLIRTIYRMTNTPFEADSRDAEAEGSLQLKREDFNQGLSSLADECEKAEYQLAELFFRAHYGVNWEREYDRADLSIAYPRDFDPTPFEDLLQQAQSLVALGMPHEVMKAVRKQIVPQALPGLTAAQTNALIDAIDQMEDPSVVAQRNQEALLKVKFNEGAPDDEDDDDPTQTE
jgi:hypothetical protein